MASLKYKLINQCLRLIQIRKFLNKDGKKMDRLVSFFDKRQKDKIPVKLLKDKCDYRIETIGDRPCVIARKKSSTPDRALLLFFGGGYIMPPDNGDYTNIIEIANSTNTEVWFPLYPLAPKASMSITMESILAVYQKMLEGFSAEKIILLGNSSGAALCLSLCIYIRENRYTIPFPKKLIMISPGMQFPPSEQQLKRMEKLERTDYMIPIKFCKDISRVLIDDQTKYLFNLFSADWKGLPDMDVYYGSHEIFSAYIPDIQQKVLENQALLKIHIGEGMMHCWPQLKGTVEGKRTWQEIHEIIKKI